jgi:WD40 repeat protein
MNESQAPDPRSTVDQHPHLESAAEQPRDPGTPPDGIDAAGPPHADELPTTVQAPSDAPLSGDTATDGPEARWPSVAGYHVLGELGRGGMGVVYKARQTRLNRLVALKMIRDGLLAGPDHLARFRLEASAVARLQNPHIVQIYEIGEQDGRPYFSLEYVDGGNLAQKLAGVPMPPDQAAELVVTLAQAVHYAHRQGIIHRDLKPGNVLLTLGGLVKITDFGLAKQLEAEVFLTHTASSVLLGTPSYMAPEQAWGKAREVGPAADVYALGAILYECLTGQPPFLAPRLLETLEQVRSRDPVPLRRLQAKVPRDLETICLKCLQKEPHKRYESANALADDLTRFLRGEPVRARPTSAWERTLKWVRRRPTTAALVGVSAVAASLFVALILALGLERTAKGLSSGDDTAKGAAPEGDAREVEYVARIGQAERALRGNNAADANRHLDACPETLRAWEWDFLKRAAVNPAVPTLRTNQGTVTALAFDPKHRLLATAGLDRTVRLWDLATGREVLTFRGHTAPVHSLAFSPNGDRIASVAEPNWGAGPGGPPFPAPMPAAPGEAPRRMPERKAAEEALGARPLPTRNLLVFAQRRSVLDLRPAVDADHEAFAEDKAAGPRDNRLAPQARPVPARSEVKVWDARTGRLILTLPREDQLITCVAFGPDGKWLVTGQGVLIASDMPVEPGVAPPPAGPAAPRDKIGPPEKAPEPKKDVGQNGQPSRYGTARRRAAPASLLVAGSWPLPELQLAMPIAQPAPDRPRVVSVLGTVKLWDATSGKELRRFDGHTEIVTAVCFSPDGQRVASAGWDGTVRLWDAATGQPLHTLHGHAGHVTSVAFSPDGQRLASGEVGESVTVWDAATGRELLALQEHGGEVAGVAFSPDGRRLASAGRDRTVRLWDPNTGQPLLILRGATAPLAGVAFSRDGHGLAAAGQDGTVTIWDGTPLSAASPYGQWPRPPAAAPPERVGPPVQPAEAPGPPVKQ